MRDLRVDGDIQSLTLYRVTATANGVEWIQYVVANSFRQVAAMYNNYPTTNVEKVEGLRTVSVILAAIKGEF